MQKAGSHNFQMLILQVIHIEIEETLSLQKCTCTKYVFTVWKFHDFFVTQILREINILRIKKF